MKLPAAAFLALVFLNSCAGGGSTQPQPVATPDRGACNALLVNDPQLALIAPPAGATGVATTIGSVTFSASRLYHDLTLSANDGSGNVTGGTITPSNGNYVSALPALRPHVTYSVTIFPSAGPCAYFPGSFTTS